MKKVLTAIHGFSESESQAFVTSFQDTKTRGAQIRDLANFNSQYFCLAPYVYL